jgi:hypothetical protein
MQRSNPGQINKTVEKSKDKKSDSKKNSVNDSLDHHEEFLHPNMMRET